MKKLYRFAAFAVLAGVAVVSYAFRLKPANRLPADIVKVDGGLISGVTNAAGDMVWFKGIPFAAPPTGELRWKAPQQVIPWKGVKKCDAFGPSPMQSKPVPFGVYTPEFLIP